MEIPIDSDAKFIFKNGRSASVDAYEFLEWKRSLYDLIGKPKKDKEGNVLEGEPKDLFWGDIVEKVTEYFKARCQIDLTPSEARGVWSSAEAAWEAVQKNWQSPIVVSPISADSTDPRFAP